MIIKDFIEWNGRKHRDKTALIHENTRISFSELDKRTNSLVRGLWHLGIKKGDRVACLMPNCPQYIVAFFATNSLGAIFTAISALYTEKEIRYQLQDSESKVLVTLDLFLDKVIHLFLRIKWIDRCYSYYVERTQKRIHKYVEKYGLLGVSVFIGIPLPGSGSYSGALGSYLLGIKFKKFALANLIGVLIAGVLVLAASLTGIGIFRYFIKVI